MVYVYATSHSSYDMVGSIMTGESQEGMQVMTEYGDGGSAMPNYAVIEVNTPFATVTYLDEKHSLGMLTWDDTALASTLTTDALLVNEVKTNIDSNVSADSVTSLSPIKWSQIYPLLAPLGITADSTLNEALTALKTAMPQYSVLIDALISDDPNHPGKLTPEV
jgi:hypothetical protein